MEFRSPWPDISLDDATLYDVIFEGMDAADAARVAFDHAETGTVLTYGEVRHQVDAVATWLAGRRPGPGGVVAIALANCPQYAIAFHAILRSGAAVTPLNVAAHPAEMARQLSVTGASSVITSTDLLGTVADAASRAGLEAGQVVVVDGAADGRNDWQEALATPPAPPTLRIDPHDVACLPMSSGTSGMPKAVMLSHRNLVANLRQWNATMEGFGPGDSVVAFLPFSHIYGLTCTMNAGLARRMTLLTMSAFQAHLFLDLVATRRPTIIYVVPPVASFLATHKAVERLDWSSVRLLVSGAAPLDEVVARAVEERLGARLMQGYGMTELSPATHITPFDRPDISRGTIGLPLPGVTARVVDPTTGRDVDVPAPGGWSEPGELWVRGPNVMLGYLHDADASARTVVDGWLHTGDLVQTDAEGVVRVVDRIKELIKRRGFQVAPVELEALLVQHPDVVDAAVLGLAHRSGDQVPHALLVLGEGITAAAATEVVAWLNAQVSQYKHLGGATVVTEVPRSASGKILRRRLGELVG